MAGVPDIDLKAMLMGFFVIGCMVGVVVTGLLAWWLL